MEAELNEEEQRRKNWLINVLIKLLPFLCGFDALLFVFLASSRQRCLLLEFLFIGRLFLTEVFLQGFGVFFLLFGLGLCFFFAGFCSLLSSFFSGFTGLLTGVDVGTNPIGDFLLLCGVFFGLVFVLSSQLLRYDLIGLGLFSTVQFGNAVIDIIFYRLEVNLQLCQLVL